MSFLKEAAALYRAEFKAHCYGAFGLPKERDVADARAAGQLMWTAIDGKLEAIAMFRHHTIGSSHTDFAGRVAKIEAGDLFIRSIAGSPGGKRKIINTLIERSGAKRAWLEGHVENPALCLLLETMGFRRAMTKIAASSDLKGLWWFGPPPVIEQLDPADVPGIKVISLRGDGAASPEDLAGVRRELDHIESGRWAQHYSSYNKRKSWTSFALAGFDPSDTSFIIKPSEMSKDWKAKNPERMKAECGLTALGQIMVSTMALVDRIPGKKQRVRFMRLAAGNGELTRHSDITDPEAGTKDGQIARLHIPIVTDPRCVFRSWALDGREWQLHFPQGTLCYIDTRKPHAVVNPSDVERIHLVVDVHCGPELRKLIAA